MMTPEDRDALNAVFPHDAPLGTIAPALRALARHALSQAPDTRGHYFHLGAEADIEDDGFITVHGLTIGPTKRN